MLSLVKLISFNSFIIVFRSDDDIDESLVSIVQNLSHCFFHLNCFVFICVNVCNYQTICSYRQLNYKDKTIQGL